MAIFAVIQTTDSKIQVGDKLRLDVSQSFVSTGEIDKIEIQPSEDEEFFELDPVSGRMFFDWIYEEPGEVEAKVRITSGEDAKVGIVEIDVVTAEADQLFSGDSDLLGSEPSIKSYLPPGKASFLFVHREAQTQIMDELNRIAGEKKKARLEAQDVGDKMEVKEWSKNLTLALIFEGMVNAADDVFSQKAEKYRSLVGQKKQLSMIALDLNKDGVISEDEKSTNLSTVKAYRS